jgi:hypothetical protein
MESNMGKKALSVQQPWAWFIVNGYKDIENRSWWPSEKLYGHKILIHAGQKRLTEEEYLNFRQIVKEQKIKDYPKSIEDFDYGALVGSAVLVMAVENSKSEWAQENSVHFVLKDAETIEPIKVKGQLKFFDPFKTNSEEEMSDTEIIIAKERLDYLLDSIADQLQLGRSLLEIERKLRPIASNEEIAKAIEIFKATSSTVKNSKIVNTLVERQDYQNWYQGGLTVPNSHWQSLKEVLKNKRTRPWTEEMVRSLDYSSDAVMYNLAPPKSEVPFTIKGLVLGYVQSGKTANFSAVISKAVDNGYKLIVVLAGVHNILRQQTQIRLHEEIVAPNERACNTLTDVDEKGDFQKKQFVSANRALGSTDGFTLVVLKKNSSVLRNFNSWLDEANEETIKQCPTLIIDDESDQASVNTNKPEDDPTAINNHIRKLVSKFRVVSYVGYTATPFANVLIDSETKDDLYPKDFIVSLEKPIGYVGTEELFGRDAIEPRGALEGLPVIRTIPSDEASVFNSRNKSKQIKESSLTSSMLNALDSFIIGCSARLARDQWKQHMTMLIHTSHLVSQHMSLKSAIEEYIQELRFARQDESEELKTRLKKVWDLDFINVTGKFKAANIPEFAHVWKNSAKFIERIEIVMENSASEDRLTYNRIDPFWGIVIGGNTLSRGLTLEGLTTSYFIRGSKGYDTLLQMGRWFGYRPNYVDLTRIFVTDDLHSKFYHLATVEQEVRDEIKTMAANGERPIDVGLKIRTHPSMTVTSNIKMRNAKSCTLTYSASKIQALYMNLKDDSVLKNNFSAVVNLLDNIEKYGGKKTAPRFENQSNCLLYRNVSPETILQFVEKYNFSEANIRFTAKMITEYISQQNDFGELKDWSVAVMSPKSGIPLDLGNNRKVFKVERSLVKKAKSERDSKAQHIKVITAPDDELVDLFDVVDIKESKYTEDFFKLYPDLTESLVRQNSRPKERGLLLLYPINPNTDMTVEQEEQFLNSESQTMPVRAVSDAIGIAFVFPKTTNIKNTFKYVVNGTV